MSICEQSALFVGGQEGYHPYRIPSMVVTGRGTVLAFCEGRLSDYGDAGIIHLLLRRSFDGGRTWAPLQVVVAEVDMTCGNPCPVVDRRTGRVVLTFCKNLARGNEGAIIKGQAPRTVWTTVSDDDGVTWSAPVEITASVKPATWTWYATGPGHGIQLASGRLIVPCDHVVGVHHDAARDPYHSHVIYSDDGGRSWTLGGIVSVGSNECQAVETEDGAIYLNARNWQERGQRAYAWSRDGGLTFEPRQIDPTLLEPPLWGGCQASMVRYSMTAPGQPSRILFANPVSREEVRQNMTLRMSTDECRTWSAGRTLWPGPAAYSDLAVAPDKTILCLYERGDEHPYQTLTLARFDLEWCVMERNL
jgi:sialidase-1